MAVRVVLRHPHHHALARLLVVVRTLVGVVLLGTGVLVGPVGIFLALGFAADRASRLTGASQPGDPGVFDEWPWPTSTLVITAAVSIGLLMLGVRVGLPLLRGNRRVVLFLRRFRDAEAIGALSSAAAGTVGGFWRVVTLDDGTIAPIGVPVGTRRLFGGLRGAYAALVLAGTKSTPAGGTLLLAAAGVVGLRYLQTGMWDDVDLFMRSLPDDRAVLGVLPVPPQPIGWDLQTLVYLLVAAGIALICLGLAAFIAMLGVMVLAGPALLAAQAAQAARNADSARRAQVSDAADLTGSTTAVVSGSRKVLAPRLVVLTVSHTWWRQAVSALAAVAAGTVVDVSEASENVLWEVTHLRATGARLVLVGHLPELGPLLAAASTEESLPIGNTEPSGAGVPVSPTVTAGRAEDTEALESGSHDNLEVTHRLAALLDGEEVLAYTLSWWGRRRFARALRATLMCRDSPDDPRIRSRGDARVDGGSGQVAAAPGPGGPPPATADGSLRAPGSPGIVNFAHSHQCRSGRFLESGVSISVP